LLKRQERGGEKKALSYPSGGSGKRLQLLCGKTGAKKVLISKLGLVAAARPEIRRAGKKRAGKNGGRRGIAPQQFVEIC